MIHNQDETIIIRLGDSTVSVPAQTILADLLKRLQPPSNAAPAATDGIPRIGAPWPGQGGIYAGTVRGEDGAPDYHLILADFADGEAMTWQAAMDWAANLAPDRRARDGHTDYTLPNRREQSILYANTREHFEDTWYWSNTQYAGNHNYAWGQGFVNGGQYNLYKDYEGRCRAVRRLVIS